MKIKVIIAVFILITGLSVNAQSDYEMVQNFKAAVNTINMQIDSAATYEKLDSLQLEISLLEKKYMPNKELLDKSLYPDDFTTVFEKLEDDLKRRRENFASVGMLQARIASLQNQLEQLNRENTKLLNRIKEYQKVGGSSSASVSELRSMVADLRTKLQQRDELVRSLVDSLLSDYVNHPMTLNEAEKQEIYEKVETGNLFYNIEKTVRDNLDYLKISTFSPEGLNKFKEDQVRFYRMWKRIGPKLSELYREQGDQTGEVAYITNLFSEWEQKLDERIWDRIRQVFRDHNAELSSFNNGGEFTAAFIELVDSKSKSASELELIQFRDSIWIAEMKVNWLPGLIDNEMITAEQKEEMQSAVNKWESKYETDTPFYWYVLIGFIVLIFLLIFIPKWKRKDKPLSEQ